MHPRCRYRAILAALIAALVLPAPGLLPAADWPHWRGPTRDGHTDESSGWAGGRSASHRPLWTAQVGSGASSPLVVADRVYTFGHADGRDIVTCLDARTGKEVWAAGSKGSEYGRFHMGDEGLYSGPSSTP